MEIDMNGSIQLTIEQRFQIEQFNRTLETTTDPEQLRQLARQPEGMANAKGSHQPGDEAGHATDQRHRLLHQTSAQTQAHCLQILRTLRNTD